MPVVALVTSVGAASTIADVFDGIRAATVPNIGGARFQATYLSAGANAVDLTEEVFVGAANPVELSMVSGANRRPQTPDDVVASFPVNPGEKITLRVSNSHATVAANHFSRLVITQLR